MLLGADWGGVGGQDHGSQMAVSSWEEEKI